jgi:hypothetical protein
LPKAAFRAVDAAEADTLRVGVVQGFDGVAINAETTGTDK